MSRGSERATHRARSWARRYALQALYQWQSTGQDVGLIEEQFVDDAELHRLFDQWLHTVSGLVDAAQLVARFKESEAAERAEYLLRQLRAATERAAQAPFARGELGSDALQALLQREVMAQAASSDPALVAAVVREAVGKHFLRRLVREFESRGAMQGDLAYAQRLLQVDGLNPASAPADSERLQATVDEVVIADRAMLKADADYFRELMHQVPARLDAFSELLRPFLGRPLEQIDPIEKAILWIATYELSARADMPYRVVINEAIELAKRFGAEQSHRFVNGALDRVARVLRQQQAGEG